MKLLFFVALLFATPAARSEVTIANVFNTRMVLPREIPTPVWGFADAGESVTVTFAGQSKTAIAGPDGKWSVTLDPLGASTVSRDLKANGDQSASPVTLTDVLVGDVWLASGQSNIIATAGTEGAAIDTPNIRFAFVESYYPVENPADLKSRCNWRRADTASAGSCSAVGLWFARRIQSELGVPVGIIVSGQGGTRIEAWTRREVLDATDVPGSYMEDVLKSAAEYEASPPPPTDPPTAPNLIEGSPEWMWQRLGGRYKGMVAPLAPFAVRGVIWYQGEQNAGDYSHYATLLPAMIADWRATWNRQLPFLIVQLPAYNYNGQPNGSTWASMREVQEYVSKTIPAGSLAVTLDNGDPDQLHPNNKRTVGERLGLLALHDIFQIPLIARGPVFDSMTVNAGSNGNAGTARINLRELGGGLVSTTGSPLTGFTIAGPDNVFLAADAVIDGNSVLVSAAGVTSPSAVRYAWVNAPSTSLANAAGLPAAPFRTDSPYPNEPTIPLIVTGWSSVSDHGGAPCGLEIPSGGLVEPRQAGVRRVEISFGEPIILNQASNAVTIAGVNDSGPASLDTLGITMQATAASNTLVVSFTNNNGPCALPDASKWRISLTPVAASGASGSVLAVSAATTRMLSGLIGDTTGNGRTTGIDLSRIGNAGAFDPLVPEILRADIDGDGAINAADRDAAWANRTQRIDTLTNP
jgi:sialate O-acetylesterase